MQIQRAITKRIKVFGIVQGVGYRYFVYDIAKKLKLNGYVKNLSDGSVEVVVSGNDLAVAELISNLKNGPVYAKVENILIEDMEDTYFDDFEIKF